MFVVTGGMTSSFLWSEAWNKIWRSVNKGVTDNQSCMHVHAYACMHISQYTKLLPYGAWLALCLNNFQPHCMRLLCFWLQKLYNDVPYVYPDDD